LSSWLRDYLYTPLAFAWRKAGTWGIYASLLVTFALIGLWHGANWTYVVFGILQAVYIIGEMLTQKFRRRIVDSIGLAKLPRLHHAIQSVIVFLLFTASFIFFRAASIGQAWAIIVKIFSGISLSALNVLDTNGFTIMTAATISLFVLEFLVLRKHSFDDISAGRFGKIVSASIVVGSAATIFAFAFWGGATFIYFQF
ncbi:MAG: hypothetical protein KGH93_03520, partial [Patescibacteria group bacterium]|nr:hypothetical protein [Patescibacteria group bacterium]